MFTFNDNSKWTKEEKDLVVKLKEEYEWITFQQISEELEVNGYDKRTAKAVQGVWRRYKEKSKVRKANIRPRNAVNPKPLDTLSEIMAWSRPEKSEYEEALEQMAEMRKKAVCEHIHTKMRIGNPVNGANIKVVSISDLHIPFYNETVIKRVLAEAKDTDVLVVNGDFLELYSVSSWPKNKTIMLRHEYEMGIKLLAEFARLFPKVVLTKGNHESRLQREFSKNLDANVSFMTSPDLLDRMAKGYDFDKDGELVPTHDFSNVFYSKGPLSWQVQIGKCVFAHPTSYSRVNMKTAMNVAQSMASKGVDFEALVIAHTHQQGTIVWNNKLIMEQGCACIPLEYEADAKATYGSQAFGYAVVWMDKQGHVDFDKSGTVYCGTGTIVDPNNIHSLED